MVVVVIMMIIKQRDDLFCFVLCMCCVLVNQGILDGTPFHGKHSPTSALARGT